MSKKEKLSTDPYKGVRDFYPEDQTFLTWLKNTCGKVVEASGYVEYHASILEPSELYKSKGVANEEIVNEQTYTFIDRGGREVTLRPEMTPTVARMVAAKRRELGFPLRYYSFPNLFRYERPQRGRLREHWQLNVDLFGSRSTSAEVEVIALAHALMRAFSATEADFEIRISSRLFLNNLVRALELSPQNSKILFGLLDRREKMPSEEFTAGLAAIGVPTESITQVSTPLDVAVLLEQLRALGVTNAKFDPSIVRGFDYYTGVVFEVFDLHPENNRALFGGGRYDNLTELFDDEPITGIGFGMGDVTIHNFLEVRNLLTPYTPNTECYLAVTDKRLVPFAMEIANELREKGALIAVDFGDKKLADQIKTATKHAIQNLIVIGDNEKESAEFVVRNLTTGEEKKCSRRELIQCVK